MYLAAARQWLNKRSLVAATASIYANSCNAPVSLFTRTNHGLLWKLPAGGGASLRLFSAGASTGCAEEEEGKKRRKGRKKSSGDTPMMRQYWQAKKAYPDCVLLFRMGDFFEVFFDDAKVVSSVLRIALTRRYRKSGQLEDAIPMCGSE